MYVKKVQADLNPTNNICRAVFPAGRTDIPVCPCYKYYLTRISNLPNFVAADTFVCPLIHLIPKSFYHCLIPYTALYSTV